MEQIEEPSILLERKDLDKDSDPSLISLLNLDAKGLYTQYPPIFRARAKILSYEKVKKEADYNPSQVVRLSRWNAMKLPETYKLSSPMQINCSDTVYLYTPRKEDEIYKQIDWHMNFSDSYLFGAYAGSLLAQDELQVLECLILGSVREFLNTDAAGDFEAYTVQRVKTADSMISVKEPTPVLIGNADRVINLDTYPDASKERPYGLYGNRFNQASDNAVDLATNILKPATRVNIIAMEAPPGGYGKYNKATIEFILDSCYTGFLAAKKESQKVSLLLREELKLEEPVPEQEVKTNIFSGFWGCGAYGGDRKLMTILQILGAQLAGVDSLTIHAVHEHG